MREFVLDLAVRETDASSELARYINDGSDFYIDLFAFLVVLSLWTIQLTTSSTDEQSCHVVAIWELPRRVGSLLQYHLLKVFD